MSNYLIISSEFPPGPGGIGRHAYCLSMSLAQAGQKVAVLTESDYATAAEITAFDKAHESHFRLQRSPRAGLATYGYRLIYAHKLIRQFKPDVIIVSGKFSLWLGALIKYIFGKKIKSWAFLHGSELQLPRKWEKKLTDFSLSKLDRLIAVSRFSLDLLSPALRQRAEIIPNGLLMSDMPANHGARIDGEHWFGWPRLLTVGSVTPRKGQQRVIKALPHLKTIWPDIRYHIVGMPTHQEAFYQLAEQLEVAGCVVFHGRVPDDESLWRCYKSADVFAMLSENQANGDVEGFGIAILEANYFGLPAIGALGCGIEEAIKDGVNGFLVDGNDPAAIADALQKALQYQSSMASQAKDFAGAYNWQQLIQQLLLR